MRNRFGVRRNRDQWQRTVLGSERRLYERAASANRSVTVPGEWRAHHLVRPLLAQAQLRGRDDVRHANRLRLSSGDRHEAGAGQLVGAPRVRRL